MAFMIRPWGSDWLMFDPGRMFDLDRTLRWRSNVPQGAAKSDRGMVVGLTERRRRAVDEKLVGNEAGRAGPSPSTRCWSWAMGLPAQRGKAPVRPGSELRRFFARPPFLGCSYP